jgi:hypothetical protein
VCARQVTGFPAGSDIPIDTLAFNGGVAIVCALRKASFDSLATNPVKAPLAASRGPIAGSDCQPDTAGGVRAAPGCRVVCTAHGRGDAQAARSRARALRCPARATPRRPSAHAKRSRERARRAAVIGSCRRRQ